MEYSEFQKAIFNEVEKGSSNLVINAVAGSGKTTTIVECCKRLHCSPKDVKFLAFNKAIVEELETKIGKFADVSTMHAFALSIMKDIFNDRYTHKYVRVDNTRWQKYVADAIYSLSEGINVDMDKKLVFKFRSNVLKVFNLARVNLVAAKDKHIISNIMEQYGIAPMFDEVNVVSKLLEQAYQIPSNLTIDFTDMLTITATTLSKCIPTYKYVFVDECQDLSKAQRQIMLTAARNGKFIAVGDRRQAINGFCGADASSFDNIVATPNTKELPLSVNYRCGKEMIKLAQGIVPQIQAYDNAIQGVITNVERLDLNMFKKNDMVLCRKCAPLVKLCLALIKNGQTATIKGNDLATDLKQMALNIKGNTIGDVREYTETELSNLKYYFMTTYGMDEIDAMGTKPYQTLLDKCKCLIYLAEHANGNIKAVIDKVFSDTKIANAITLMSIHKAKGLESERVVFLEPNLTMKKTKKQKQWQFDQEQNLQYVAVTRAKKELILCSSSEIKKDKNTKE